MSAPSLVDYIADSAGRLQTAHLTERDLDRIEFARRALKRAAKRVRKDLRERAGVSGVAVNIAVVEGHRDAVRALAGSPWEPTCRLRGSSSVLFMARHGYDGGTILVQAKTLAGLQRGVALVEVDTLTELERGMSAPASDEPVAVDVFIFLLEKTPPRLNAAHTCTSKKLVDSRHRQPPAGGRAHARAAAGAPRGAAARSLSPTDLGRRHRRRRSPRPLLVLLA